MLETIRVRYDKTSEYRAGGKILVMHTMLQIITGNQFIMIQKTFWKTEITLDMLNEETEDIYYNGMKRK